ncbi:MAG: tetratricopeptide repeat protein [Chloroflexi bacterium]|nr:tetratricopeptide repeat protein [Chloroflexota bacterium]
MDNATAFRLAMLRSNQGDFDGAQAGFQSVLDAGGTGAALAAAELGRLAQIRGDSGTAQTCYAKAVELGFPDPVGASNLNWGRFFEAQGMLPQAELAFANAIESSDALTSTRAALESGMLYQRQGRGDNAEAAYLQAVGSPEREVSGRALFALGDLFKNQQRLSEARVAYRAVMESPMSEMSGPATYQWGRVLKQEGNVYGASVAYRLAATSSVPRAADPASFNLGLLLEERGELDAAEAAYVLAADSENEDIVGRARSNLVRVRIARAFTEFARRTRVPPADEVALQLRGNRAHAAVDAVFASVSMLDLQVAARKYVRNAQIGNAQLRYIGARWFGSWQRNTLIAPHDLAPLNLLVAFEARVEPHAQIGRVSPDITALFDDGEAFLQMMADVLNQVEASGEVYAGACVRLDFGQPPFIDLYPAVHSPDTGPSFLFPRRGRGAWLRSDPVRFDASFAERDIKLRGHLSMLARMLMSWNRHRNAGLPTRYIEDVLHRQHATLSGNWPVDLQHFFETAMTRGDAFSHLGPSNRFVEDLGEEVSSEVEARVSHELKYASSTMAGCVSAVNRADVRSALALVRELFGREFPTE